LSITEAFGVASPVEFPFERDTLNYPGECVDIIGQVVGPNWLDEHFVITDVTCICDVETGVETTIAHLEHLTGERKALVTSEAKREFVAKTAAIKLSDDIPELPSWKLIREVEDTMTKSHLWI
jgi:hypothetical protein